MHTWRPYSGPILEPLPPVPGAFRVIYKATGPKVLQEIRSYQKTIHTQYPGWTAVLDFDAEDEVYRLNVLPTQFAPLWVLNRPDRYAR